MKNRPITQEFVTKSLHKTIIKLSPAILTALIATGLGFLSLYTSQVPMIQDFGKMLTIGMIVSFVVALLILMPLLFTRDYYFSKKNVKIKIKKQNKLDRMLYRFTKIVIKLRWFILTIALLSAILGVIVDQKVKVETDIETFMPQETQELKDIQKLRSIIGSTDQVSIVYESKNIFDRTNLTWITQTTDTLSTLFPNEVVKTKSITTLFNQLKSSNNQNNPSQLDPSLIMNQLPKEQTQLLINDEQTKGVIIVAIKHLESKDLEAFLTKLTDHLNTSKPDDLNITVTGKAVVDVEMVSSLTTGRYKITLIGMLAVFIGLLIIYRNILKAAIPLIPIILIVGWSGGFMYLLGIHYTPLTATLGALIIGIGTEFTILVMERYAEEREKQSSNEEAISISVSKIGAPIFASALTTIGGFSALIISDFQILSNFGIMTLINISLALVSTLVVMPAILSIQFKKKLE